MNQATKIEKYLNDIWDLLDSGHLDVQERYSPRRYIYIYTFTKLSSVSKVFYEPRWGRWLKLTTLFKYVQVHVLLLYYLSTTNKTSTAKMQKIERKYTKLYFPKNTIIKQATKLDSTTLVYPTN